MAMYTELNAALVGLALTYISSLIGILQYTVRQSAEVENIVSRPTMFAASLHYECNLYQT